MEAGSGSGVEGFGRGADRSVLHPLRPQTDVEPEEGILYPMLVLGTATQQGS